MRGVRVSRLFWSVLFFGAVWGRPAGAAPLAGTFSSPVGTVQLSEAKDGTIAGKVVSAKNPCGFPKGTVVVTGARLDDSLAATIKACKLITDTCAGFVDGDAVLLITRRGSVLSGAVHFNSGGCKTPVGGDSIVFRKLVPKTDRAAVAAVKIGDRDKAHALAVEGQKALQAGEAEDARKKFHEAIAADPSYSEGYIGIGVTYAMRARYDEALEFYEKGLEANPGNPDAYYNIACVHAIRAGNGTAANKDEIEHALRYLGISIMNGYVQLETLSSDPDLTNLAGDPRFEKMKTGIVE